MVYNCLAAINIKILLIWCFTAGNSFQWSCSEVNSNLNRMYLPNLNIQHAEFVLGQMKDNIVRKPMINGTYIFPITSLEASCSGVVKSIDYCFTSNTAHGEESDELFNLYVMELMVINFKLVANSTKLAIPFTEGSEECIDGIGSTEELCCNQYHLRRDQEFQISSSFAFGIDVSSFDSKFLLGYTETSNYVVPLFIALSGIKRITSVFASKEPLFLIRFGIGK